MRTRLETLFASERSWLLVSCTRDPDVDVDDDDAWTAGLRHLAALEEYTLVESEGAATLYAWAADDDELLLAILTLLGWDQTCSELSILRGDGVVEHAVEEGGATLVAAVARAAEAGTAGIHLRALARQVEEETVHA